MPNEHAPGMLRLRRRRCGGQHTGDNLSGEVRSWEEEPNALASACSAAGCRLVRRVPTGTGDPPVWQVECPTRWETVDLLSELAQRDSADPELRALASDIIGESYAPLPPEHIGATLLAWVQQHVPFVPEEIETFKGWRETIAHGGDCDDSARLLVAMLLALGFRARLATFGTPPTHVLAQVLIGNEWQWMEATVPGAEFGEHPLSACKRLGLPVRADLAGAGAE